ncbi:D-tyrosyl-tRNA(Tyr) deacylase [Paenibacillus sp. FSL H7-0326]|uniref:D-aminoacyl-tRNA deacylase n=1 Tax=Paenibacillus sp. FSL H7-0326 TaxID=1921144 RepID=UPI00096C756A|nr:D-aminoacyl-tRNA deacylase [Paenibacillus sp. FSL H7-0326]OMC69227.1 D-tyrosyl-tRNA(Tyr) deacylase [Paenibacillus sp. FSL H7-0326]
MRVVLQRVSKAKVTVDQEIVGQINRGFMLLVGITHEDTLKDADYLAEKIAGLRVFEDEAGKMNNSIMDVGGAILSVSQFTLYGDTRKGKRPNFMAAARPDVAEPLYAYFNEQLRSKGLIVETGKFGAMMDVALNNDGPVTLILESKV